VLKVVLNSSLNTFHLDLNFSAETGKTTVLLGESGAGKSSVLRFLAGLLYPQKGHISLDDVTYFDSEQHIVIPPQMRAFGYVFQDYALFPHLNVFENVAFGLHSQHLSSRVVHQRVEEILEQMRLPGLSHRRPAQLSGGQQQRVAIARALALHPQLLLLDEPLSALDVQTRREVRQELRGILANVNITTVMVTHSYVEALLFGYHIIVLEGGRIIQQGDKHTLLQKPRSPYVAELAGTNFFRGRVVQSDTNALCTVQLSRNDGQDIKVQAVVDEPENMNGVQGVGQEACIVVDPSSITLHLSPPENHEQNIFRGEIIQLLHSGTSVAGAGTINDRTVRASVLLNGSPSPLSAELTSASASLMALNEGQTVYATFKASDARAYI